MASAERRAREKENLRRAILDAARDLFVSEGYEAVSMRKIAEKIEYSPTALYHHFKDKEEILFHLVEEGFEMLRDRLQAIAIEDPIIRLREGGKVYLQFAREQQEYFHLMFQAKNTVLAEKVCMLQNCEIEELYGFKEEIGQNCFMFITRCVADAMESGQFRQDNVLVTAHVIWAHIHGAASLDVSGSLFMLPSKDHERFFTDTIETTINGLLA